MPENLFKRIQKDTSLKYTVFRILDIDDLHRGHGAVRYTECKAATGGNMKYNILLVEDEQKIAEE